ncbi:hypothetical protein [Flavobacterium gelatinilyticum]|uniref:hypothetical protein n=1 Tax=Flavobacterium gelatinilyticum TaxID=3003260 RepID=UPI00248145FE|nr:hypothetical protein [Flavobacterium gelatinilyticum]
MESTRTNSSENFGRCIPQTTLYPGDNNELIFLKTYSGDWGDWDEKADTTICDPSI